MILTMLVFHFTYGIILYSIDERSRTNNCLVDYHRQLNARVQTNSQISEHGLMKFVHLKNLFCAAKNRFKSVQQDHKNKKYTRR